MPYKRHEEELKAFHNATMKKLGHDSRLETACWNKETDEPCDPPKPDRDTQLTTACKANENGDGPDAACATTTSCNTKVVLYCVVC